MWQSSSNREVYRNTTLLQETRKISNKQPNLMPKDTRGREKKNPIPLGNTLTVKETNLIL